jgi:hypothetical protein
MVGVFAEGLLAGRLLVQGDYARGGYRAGPQDGIVVYAIPRSAVLRRRHDSLVLDATPAQARGTWPMDVAAMRAPSSDQMYTRLMAIHHDACATGRYEVSYYLLSAMRHLASERGDDTRLLEMSREDSERQAWLDTHEPTHPLATCSGHPGAFDVLASIALARTEMGQAKHPGPNRESGQ